MELSVPQAESFPGITRVGGSDDDSPVYCSSLHPDISVDNFLIHPVTNCWELFCQGAESAGDPGERLCLGTRDGWTGAAGFPQGAYQWLTYAQVGSLAIRLVLNIFRYGLCPAITFPPQTRPSHQEAPTLRCLGLYSKNRLEWFICEQAANIAGLTLVPLYDTFGKAALEHIICQTKLDTIVVSWGNLSSLLPILRLTHRQTTATSKGDCSRELTESTEVDTHDESSSPSAVSSSVKHIILLPPYPCLHPSHFHPPLPSPQRFTVPTTNNSLQFPVLSETNNDLGDTTTRESLEISTQSFSPDIDSEYTNETQCFTTARSAVDKPMAESYCSECCPLTGSLWYAPGPLGVTELIKEVEREFTIQVYHWSTLIQFPNWTFDAKKNVGDVVTSLLSPSCPIPLLFSDPIFDLHMVRSLAREKTIQTICYTSGTTGCPKGVVITHANIVSTVAAAVRGPFADPDIVVTDDACHLSYLPLCHIMERIVVNLVYIKGARIGIYSGEIKQVLSDLSLLRPTVFVAVPRVLMKINDNIVSRVLASNKVSQLLFAIATDAKLKNYRQNPRQVKHPLFDRLVFGKMRDVLGGRIQYVLVGGAPIDEGLQERLAVLLSVPVIQGYGLTETMGVAFNGLPSIPAGYVGSPFPSIQFKLRDVPDLNYRVNEGVHPRGELLLRGPSLTEGYFDNRDETEQLFSDGWLCTGDVVELRLDVGLLKVIDRQKNFFKLLQGEFIAPEKLEGIYQQAPLVEQIWVFGYSSTTYVVAIVVPDAGATVAWCQRKGFPVTPLHDLCRERRDVDTHATVSTEFHAAVMEELNQQATNAELKGFERVQHIRLTSLPFTVENDLLTPTLKLKRHVLYQSFKQYIDEMYQ